MIALCASKSRNVVIAAMRIGAGNSADQNEKQRRGAAIHTVSERSVRSSSS
jgi:hypothetical protein